MKNYIIIVEGAHDIATIERVLSLNGVAKRINKKKDLPGVWTHAIPDRYPFDNNRLDRIAPIPSFVKNENISVAIKNANSDSEIISSLCQMLHYMEIGELAQIDGIMLVCDADEKNAFEKRKYLLDMWTDTEEFQMEKEEMKIKTFVKEIPVYIFIFPDNCNLGNLENLLLKTAEISYPELLAWASDYITKAGSINSVKKSLERRQDRNKAIIGCIANTMKPGKANQVSVADNNWITEKTLEKCEMLQRLNESIKKMLEN